jgi:YVTN family beta-propeller protein
MYKEFAGLCAAKDINRALVLLCLLLPWLMIGSMLTAGTRAEGAGISRIYVGNAGDATVSVIDHDSRVVIKTIDIGAKHHGSVPSHAGDRIYMTTEDTGEVIAVDTGSNEILWRVKAGATLHEPSITHDDRFVFAPDFRGGRIAIVDARSGKLVDDVKMIDPDTNEPFDGLHNTYEMSDGRHLLSMSILGESMIKIDMNTREIVRIYRLNGQPRPAAIMQDMSMIFVQLSELNGFIAVDLETGRELKRIEWPFEGEPPEKVDPWTPSHGMGLAIDDHELWAASSFTSQLYVYSVPELEQLAVVDVGVLPNWMALSKDGKILYATSQEPDKERGTVAVIDTASHEVLKLIEVGPRPKRIHLVELPFQ